MPNGWIKQKITVKAPRGSKLDDGVVKKAQAAAQAVLDKFGGLYKTVADLNAQGISITLEELLSRHGGKAKATRKARRKKIARKSKTTRKKSKGKERRTVLTAEQRKSLTEMLKAGATAGKVAVEFGVSPATVNNIKRAAGLTKSKGATSPKAPPKKVARKSKATRKKSKGKARRTVLTAEQRKNLTERLKAGATAGKVAAEFSVSPTTVKNIKRAAGLIKPRRKPAKKSAE